MIAQLRKVPNQLTAIRFVTVLLMWVCAFYGAFFLIGIGFLIGAVTDSLDGILARRLNQASDFGSQFDSVADRMLHYSAIIWIFWLMPEILRENTVILLSAIGINLASFLVGLIKFRRFANLHLYLTKLTSVFLYIFITHAFLTGRYSPFLFLLAMVFYIISSTESLILQLTSKEVNQHMGSLLFRYIDEDHPVRRFVAHLP
jgi:phosphatidylglycerophosphate synthase